MARPAVIAGVRREATQPTADHLLGYPAYLARLARLAANPRVRVWSIGTSHAGRDIPVIAITSPELVHDDDRLRGLAARLAGPTVVHRSVSEPVLVLPALAELPADARVPVLLAGGSFGFEASHLEGLLELAEVLASRDDPGLEKILDSLMVLIVPCMNPDGREQALAEWRDQPLSSGASGLGNFYGVLENRDFLHLSQPESQALGRLVADWHPCLVWDAHEDGFLLGREFPEVCLAPPTGVDEPSQVGAELTEQVKLVGAAIAASWQREGFAHLFHPRGDHAWMKARDDQPVAKSGFGGRLAYAMGLQGIPAFITESARALGTQSWEDRNRQKVTAGVAILEQAASDPAGLAGAVRAVRTRAFETARAASDFYLIPADQDPRLIAEAVRVLQAHGIDVYRTEPEAIMYVVPVAQPARHAIDALLGAEAGAQDALSATLGIRSVPSTALPETERARWATEPLAHVGPRPFSTSPGSTGSTGSTGSPVTIRGPRAVRIPNSIDGVTLVNRLLRLPGADVRWVPGSAEAHPGDFLVAPSVSEATLSDCAIGLRVALGDAGADDNLDSALPLAPPRIGLYVGQGVNYAQGASAGSLRWLLHRWEFAVVELGADDLTEPVLQQLDLLIVPNGSAAQIMHGWDPQQLWYGDPWDMPGDRHGIATSGDGAAAIKQFVAAGGSYLGIDAGGGWLAGPAFLGLLDFEVSAFNLGIGIVDLELTQPQASLFSGFQGSWSETGVWRPGVMRGLYWSEPFSDIDGGSVFQPGQTSQVLATYAGASGAAAAGTLVDAERLARPGADAAIVSGAYGRGKVTVLGIEPSFRCYWYSTFRLVSNAAFSAVTGEVPDDSAPERSGASKETGQ